MPVCPHALWCMPGGSRRVGITRGMTKDAAGARGSHAARVRGHVLVHFVPVARLSGVCYVFLAESSPGEPQQQNCEKIAT